MNGIKKQRLILEMTQEDLAIKMGVTQSAVTKWENGVTLPRAELLPKIAQILNCSVDELLRGECASDGSSEQEKLQADTC